MKKDEEEKLNKKLDALKTEKGDIVESSVITIASFFPIASGVATGWSEWKNIRQNQNIHDILKKYMEQLQNIE